MKKIAVLIMAVLLSGCLYGKNKGFSIASNIKNSINKKIKIKSIRNGIVSTQDIYTLKPKQDGVSTNSLDQSIVYYAYPNGDRFNSKSNLMIKFNDKDIDIETIEQQYGLKLIRKMNSGDYLFKIIDGDVVNIINSLIQDKSLKIKRIKPNVKLNVKPL